MHNKMAGFVRHVKNQPGWRLLHRIQEHNADSTTSRERVNLLSPCNPFNNDNARPLKHAPHLENWCIRSEPPIQSTALGGCLDLICRAGLYTRNVVRRET